QNDLVDPAPLAASVLWVLRVAQADDEHVLAVDRVHVDGAVEGDRQARLQVETVQRVDDADVVVVRRPRYTVRQREIDPPAGELARIGDREPVTRERTAAWGRKIERREGAWQAAAFQQFDVQPASSATRSHGENSSQTKGGLRYHARVTHPARRPSAGAVPGRWGACLAVRTPPAACLKLHCFPAV